MNASGSFVMRAERVGRDTTLAQIARLVEQAQGSKAPIQRVVDQVTARFVPAVVLVAAVAFARLDAARPRAAPAVGADRGGRGADHRLPLRHGPGHADRDHGRHRQGSRGRHPGPRRRGARAGAADHRGGARQDRHHHPRRAVGRWRCGRSTGRARTSCCASRRPRSEGSEHPLAEAIVRLATERGVEPRRPPPTSRRSPAEACGRASRARACWSAASGCWPRQGVDLAPLGRSGASRRRRRRPHARARRGGRPGGRADRRSPTRSSPSRPRRCAACRPRGWQVWMITGDRAAVAHAIGAQVGIGAGPDPGRGPP